MAIPVTYQDLKDEYPFKEWEHEYNKGDFLGAGGYGSVYRAWDKTRKRHVALKFYKEVIGQQNNFTVIDEIEKAINMQHQNLVQYYAVYKIKDNNPIENTQVAVMEYADSGTLTDFLQKPKNSIFYYKIITDVLLGLEFLEKECIIHRDIKPENILVHNDRGEYIAKIADFGLAKLMNEKIKMKNRTTSIYGTPEYMAPERFLGNINIKTNSDLWSLGIILYQIFTNKLPFGSRTTGQTTESIQNNICTKNLPTELVAVQQPYQNVIRKCLEKDPNKRVQSPTQLLRLLGHAKKVSISIPPKEQIASQTAEQINVKIGATQNNHNNSKTITSKYGNKITVTVGNYNK